MSLSVLTLNEKIENYFKIKDRLLLKLQVIIL